MLPFNKSTGRAAITETGRALRWLCVKPLLWVGAISYPLYLVHQHVGMTIMLKAGDAHLNPWIGLALATAAALALGALLHSYIERPTGDWIIARWRRIVAAERQLVPIAAEAPFSPAVPSFGDPSQGRLAELDALRGLGAILVVNFHYATRFHEMFPGARHVPFHIFGGNYRVLLFFAISGFAIFFTMKHVKTAKDFVVGRFARLFPAYWAAMALTLAVEHYGGIPILDIPPAAILVNLTMLESYFYIAPVDGAYWTLGVELGFYASMLSLWSLGVFKRLEPTILIWLGLKWVAFYWPGFPYRLSSLLVLSWIPFFSVGMLSYRVWAGDRYWREQIPYLLAILVTITFTETPDIIIAAVLLIACFVLMVEGRLRWLCARPLIWFGGISYSLYLVHQNVGFVIMIAGDRYGVNPFISYALAVSVAIAFGVLINRYIERPAANFILRKWKHRRAAPARLTPA